MVQIADIYQQNRDRVSLWLDWWDELGFDNLADDPKRVRPALLVSEATKKNLRLCRTFTVLFEDGLSTSSQKIGISVIRDTLKRTLKE